MSHAPEANPECHVFFEGNEDQTSAQTNCKKDPDPREFIPVSTLTPDHVPKEYAGDPKETVEWIRYYANFIVKILVRGISKDRPDRCPISSGPYPYSEYRGNKHIRITGTGSLNVGSCKHVKEPCPCPQCQEKVTDAKMSEHWIFKVATALHVVFDETEAKSSVIECFYDSEEDRLQNVIKILYGIGFERFRCLDSMYKTDKVDVICVTHDKDIIDKFRSLQSPHESKPHESEPGPLEGRSERFTLGFIISHPRGGAKKVTLGQFLYLFCPVNWIHSPGKALAFNHMSKCRLPLLPWSTRDLNDHCATLLNLKPGAEFSFLPRRMTFTLPEDAKFAFQYEWPGSLNFTLPKGTRFHLEDGTEVFLPPEAEFYTDHNLLPGSYLAYTIPTCPGSSGAPIYMAMGAVIEGRKFRHWGAGTNYGKSGSGGIESLVVRSDSFAGPPTTFDPKKRDYL